MKNHIGLKKTASLDKIAKLSFFKINWLVFFALQHIALYCLTTSLAELKIENFATYILLSMLFFCAASNFFSEVFLKHFEHALCHVLCTYQNRCWAISTGQKKTCDIIIHLVPRLTFRHIGDFHDTHMRSLPRNCN